MKYQDTDPLFLDDPHGITLEQSAKSKVSFHATESHQVERLREAYFRLHQYISERLLPTEQQ